MKNNRAFLMQDQFQYNFLGLCDFYFLNFIYVGCAIITRKILIFATPAVIYHGTPNPALDKNIYRLSSFQDSFKIKSRNVEENARQNLN